jgi:Mrp family chromosome partitioning ATPase
VTSALPGDGKTFTALHLALSMALERDHSVLLVDGDVARPQLSRVLGLAEEPGLLDLLADPARRARDLVLGTDVEGLYLLPAGRPREGAAELLASNRMGAIFSELGGTGRRQLVVMDSPPLLVSGEARVLSASAGQVVLVVRSGVTPRGAVTHAIAALGQKRKPRLVLNGYRAGVGGGYMPDGYQGYGYGYGYGEESREGEGP